MVYLYWLHTLFSSKPFDQVIEAEITLRNTGKVGFQFSVLDVILATTYNPPPGVPVTQPVDVSRNGSQNVWLVEFILILPKYSKREALESIWLEALYNQAALSAESSTRGTPNVVSPQECWILCLLVLASAGTTRSLKLKKVRSDFDLYEPEETAHASQVADTSHPFSNS